MYCMPWSPKTWRRHKKQTKKVIGRRKKLQAWPEGRNPPGLLSRNSAYGVYIQIIAAFTQKQIVWTTLSDVSITWIYLLIHEHITDWKRHILNFNRFFHSKSSVHKLSKKVLQDCYTILYTGGRFLLSVLSERGIQMHGHFKFSVLKVEGN